MAEVPTDGTGLEARVQRLFLAQGVFAERGLLPAATPDHRMLATDIDVLVSEYVSGFHLTRRHAECKGGKAPPLDRILWLCGVRTLLGADGSYLVGANLELEAAAFARSLNIQILTMKQLEQWEASVGIKPDVWPCRSDFRVHESSRKVWTKLAKDNKDDEQWGRIRDIVAFIEIDSWLTFSYRNLNRLFRLLSDLVMDYSTANSGTDISLAGRYVFSALLVRFAQYLLAVCLDVSIVQRTDMKEYLRGKLTFGDQDPARSKGLIRATIDWIGQGLEHEGLSLPAQLDAGRIYAPPQYADEFTRLIERLIVESNEARYLPIAMEVAQFGIPDSINALPRLKAAAAAGDSLAGVVRAFLIRSCGVPQALGEPLGSDLRRSYLTSTTPPPRQRMAAARLPL